MARGRNYMGGRRRVRRSIANENYVFYNRLATDFGGHYEPLYNKAVGVLEDNLLSEINVPNRITYVRQLAMAEREKEIEALRIAFGGQLPSLLDPNDIDEASLVRFMNAILNTYSIFERNLALIRESEGGQKNTSTFFDHYIGQALMDPRILEAIANEPEVLNGTIFVTRGALTAAVRRHEDEIIDLALEYMSNAGVETGIGRNRERYANAYREILDTLGQLRAQNNEYVQEFLDVYNLNGLFEELEDDVIRQGTFSAANFHDLNQRILNRGGNWTDSRGRTQRGSYRASMAGNAQEVFLQMFINALNDQRVEIHNDEIDMSVHMDSSLRAFRTGGAGIADDVIATIGINNPENLVEQLTATDPSKISRLETAAAFCRNLAEYSNGLIVHISSKDYTLNSNFRRSGGYSTTEMNPQSLERALETMGIYRPGLIYSLLQLCEGAIGDTTDRRDLSNEIAQYFAQIFFDDVLTIGDEIGAMSSGPVSIHMLYLNGVQIPLSVFLMYFADAIEAAWSSGTNVDRSVVRVNISAPPILFPEEEQRNSMADWVRQRNYAMQNIRIQTHFLAGMRQFIGSIFGS